MAESMVLLMKIVLALNANYALTVGVLRPSTVV